jgi:hypothetical protein
MNIIAYNIFQPIMITFIIIFLYIPFHLSLLLYEE